MSNKIQVEIEDITTPELSGYKIKRTINKQPTEIELTRGEIYAAYDYYEKKSCHGDINTVLESMVDDDGEDEREELYGYTVNEIRSNESLMEDILDKYKNYSDNCDDEVEWQNIARNAIYDTLKEHTEIN